MTTKLVLAVSVILVNFVGAAKEFDEQIFCSCMQNWLAKAPRQPITTFANSGLVIHTDKNHVDLIKVDVQVPQKNSSENETKIKLQVDRDRSDNNIDPLVAIFSKRDFIDKVGHCAFAQQNEQAMEDLRKIIGFFEDKKIKQNFDK